MQPHVFCNPAQVTARIRGNNALMGALARLMPRRSAMRERQRRGAPRFDPKKAPKSSKESLLKPLDGAKVICYLYGRI
jgi:hypothetical protein